MGRLRLAGLGVALGLLGAAAGGAAADEIVGLLRLDGDRVKWGDPALGAAAEVTWATLERPRAFPGARNCGEMLPVKGLLGPLGASEAEFNRELEAALAVWSRAARILFRRVADDSRAQIVIGAQNGHRGVAFTNVVRAEDGRDGVAGLVQATVCLDPSERWELAADGDPATYNLRYVLAHELGHAIGLDHYGRTGGLMGYGYVEPAAASAAVALSARDLAAVAWLYGSRSALPPAHAPVVEASIGCGTMPSPRSVECGLAREATASGATDRE